MPGNLSRSITKSRKPTYQFRAALLANKKLNKLIMAKGKLEVEEEISHVAWKCCKKKIHKWENSERMNISGKKTKESNIVGKNCEKTNSTCHFSETKSLRSRVVGQSCEEKNRNLKKTIYLS